MSKRSALFPILFLALCVRGFAAPSPEQLSSLDETIQSLVDSGKLVGAQIVVGRGPRILMDESFGVRSVEDDTPINGDTLCCIGSCSKPIAAAVVLSLVDDGELDLTTPIDKWLPEFEDLDLEDGKADRAPNLGELLSHQAGIYSQKKGMTRRQGRWIRDFKLSLEESVKGIAGEPLIAAPSTEYAYSGAGYCVLGRVAEVAVDKDFEVLLKETLTSPLGMSRTTYFPASEDKNLATGSQGGKPSGSTPHLSKPFNLPLIGGSLYSTASDSAKFHLAVLKQEASGEELLLSAEQFEQYTTPYSDKSSYAFGWNTTVRNEKLFGLGHSGALASSRGLFQVNRKSGVYFALVYTIADPRESGEVGRHLNEATRPVYFSNSDSPK